MEKELLKSIEETKALLNVAIKNFECAEGELIDYYIYEIKANKSKLSYYIKKVKENIKDKKVI